MNATAKTWLRLAAGLSLAVTVFQAVISFVPSWSLYFGAPAELVANYPLLLASGLGAAVFFAVFGLYALSGAGDIRRLPWLRLGLPVIGGIYTLRGLVAVPQFLAMIGVLPESLNGPPQALPSSLVSLFIGLVYLTGTVFGWRDLARR